MFKIDLLSSQIPHLRSFFFRAVINGFVYPLCSKTTFAALCSYLLGNKVLSVFKFCFSTAAGTFFNLISFILFTFFFATFRTIRAMASASFLCTPLAHKYLYKSFSCHFIPLNIHIKTTNDYNALRNFSILFRLLFIRITKGNRIFAIIHNLKCSNHFIQFRLPIFNGT